MFSKKSQKRTISAPLEVMMTAGTQKFRNLQQEFQENQVANLDLNFPFPRPPEQTPQNMFDSSHYISAKDSSRKKYVIRKGNDVDKTYVRLVHAILHGENEESLTKKIEDAEGLQTLLDLKLRIIGTSSKESVSKP